MSFFLKFDKALDNIVIDFYEYNTNSFVLNGQIPPQSLNFRLNELITELKITNILISITSDFGNRQIVLDEDFFDVNNKLNGGFLGSKNDFRRQYFICKT